MKYLYGVTTLLTVLVVLFVGNANASIILSNVDNDLLIEIENSIIFDVSSNASTTRLGFKLPGAIDVAGTGGFQLTTEPATAPNLIESNNYSGGPDAALLRGGPDLEILYYLSDTVNLGISDQVTLTEGEIILPNFFDFSIINGLNYTIATEVILSQTGGFNISEPTLTAVPLPSALFLFSSALLLFGANIRHRK